MILISKYMVPRGYTAISIYPFILLSKKELRYSKILMNHEKIHLRQQLELLILPFYLLYIMEFLVRLVQYKNWQKAYLNISFEREAYCNEKRVNYLHERRIWGFLNYLGKHEV